MRQGDNHSRIMAKRSDQAVAGWFDSFFWPFPPAITSGEGVRFLWVLCGGGLGMVTTEAQVLVVGHAEDAICSAGTVMLRLPRAFQMRDFMNFDSQRRVLPPNYSQNGFWESWVGLGF